MWKRKDLKARAKEAFKSSYWASVLIAVIMVTVVAGSSVGVSLFAPHAASTSTAVASKAVTAVSADGEADEISDLVDEITDADEIPDLDLDAILGEYGLSENTSPSIDSALNNLAENIDTETLMLCLAVIGLLVSIIAVIAILLNILLINPILVAGYQFFKENALERTASLKFDFNNKYSNVVLGMFLRSLFIALWSLLFIIPGIIKSYSYRMVPFILTDNPDISATDAITLSRKMMKGNKWRAFVLDLSFIGWYILSGFTFGILSIFYVRPYVYATEAELYHAIKGGERPTENMIADEVQE